MSDKTGSMLEKKMFVDVPAAAKLAGLSERHFRRIMKKEGIRYADIGGRRRVLTANLKQWIATRNNAPKKSE